VDRIAERLVDVAGDVGVKADHLADGHLGLPEAAMTLVGPSVQP
jgi:hypothetical protein